MNEIWRPLPGYTGRYISTHGRLRKGEAGKPNLGTINNRGYRIVHYKNDHGETRVVAVAKLMSLAFDDMIIRHGGIEELDHIDGDRTNNAVWNLRYVTHKENCANAIWRRRQERTMTKDKRERYVLIDAERAEGMIFRTYTEAARAMKCSTTTIQRIADGDQKRNGFGILSVKVADKLPGLVPLF